MPGGAVHFQRRQITTMKKITSGLQGKMKRGSKPATADRGSRALTGSISTFCKVLAVSAITALGIDKAGAATYFWDPTGTKSTLGGGVGTWDSGTTPNWWPGGTPGATLDTTWDNSGLTDAIFGNTGGTVSVDDAVKVGSITIRSGGYSFNRGASNDGVFQFTIGGTNTITVTNPGQQVTMNTFLAGTTAAVTLTKAGAGILILDGDSSGSKVITGGTTPGTYNGIQGGIIISGGMLVLDYVTNSPAVILNTANTLTFTNSSEFQFKASSSGTAGANMVLSTLTFSGGEGTVHSSAGTLLEEAVLTFSGLAPRAAGATGNFVQDALPKTYSVPAVGGSTTITMTNSDGGQLLVGQSVTGSGIAASTTVSTIGAADSGGVGFRNVTLSAAPTGAASTRNLTFAEQQKRIILNGQATGFINQGIFFNGDSFAWYDTANFARVRGINYGVDPNTATQGATNAGIVAGSANKHVQVTGDIAGQGTLTVLTLNLSGSSFVGGIIQNPGTTLTLTNAGILKSGGGSATISGGTIQAGPAGLSELVVRSDITSDRLFINSVLTAVGVTKSGLGSLLLNPQTSGALSFSGVATTLNSTTLQLAPTNPANPAVLTTGLAVNGPGIPAGTTIVSVSGSTVTLSQPANAPSSLPLSYSTTLDSTTANITLSPAEAGTLTVGQTVTGAGIAPNTVIALNGINTATGVITLSTPPTASAPLQTVTFGGSTVAFGSTQNFNVVAGPLNNDHSTTTINSQTLTLTNGIPSLVAGMSVDGPGIVPGTTIASVAGTTVTLSQVATASSTSAFGAVNTYVAQVGNGSNATILSNTQANTLVLGALVTGVNILPNTTVANITPAGGGNSNVTFSNPEATLQQLFPASTVPSGATTVTLPAGQASLLSVNTSVTGSGIASGTTVVAIDTANNIVTLSKPTTSSISTLTQINFGATTNQDLTFGGASVSFGARTITLTNAQAASVVVGSTVTGVGVPANTTVVSIQDLGSYKVATLSKPTTGTALAEFVSFGGATVVGINSAYGGNTLVNAGIFAVNASGLPAAGSVTIAAGAEFAAVNSVIPNAITITGANAVLSAAGGNNGGFSGGIGAGTNDFLLRAQDFSTTLAANLNVSGPITGSGRLTVPNTSNGIVTLSGNNIGFTGPVSIENGAILSIARLNSLPNGNAIDIAGTGTLKLALDGGAGAPYALGGNGTGAPQTLTFTSSVNVLSGGTIQPDRDGTAYGGYFTRAGNKTIQLNQLTVAADTLTIQNNAGSGVEFTGLATMTGASIFSVVNATASNVVQGLTLSGKLTGGDNTSGQETFRKTGSGTLVLANNSNDFGGNGSLIHIRGGVLAFASTAALGNPTNAISLDWETNGNSGAVPATLRATGNVPFSTARSIGLNSTSNIIEVVGGQTFTVTSPFTLPAGFETNPLTKGENGVLVLSANNNPGTAPWNGTVLINAGAIRIQSGNALGNQAAGTAARVTVARSGAALQIGGGAGGVSVNNPLTLNGSGLSSAGALQSLSSAAANSVNNQIILSGGTTIGADLGSTLNVTGGITGVNGVNLTLNSAGTINITGSALDPVYAFSGDLGSNTTVTNVSNITSLVVGMGITGPNIQSATTITAINLALNQITISKAATATVTQPLNAQGLLNLVKNGNGTANLGVDSPSLVGSITVNQGTFVVGGTNVTIGNPAAATGNSILVQGPSGIFVVDDTAAVVGDRIPGNRNIGLAGGTLVYNGNAAGSSENFGTLTTSRSATNVVQSNPSGAATVALNFGSLTINGDSNVDFQGAGLGVNGTNKITFTAAPGVTSGLLQRATINGVDFVSYNSNGAAANVNGIQAFTAYNVSNNIDSAAATDTLSLTNAALTFTNPKTINAFRISGGATVTDTGLQGNSLTLNAGAILSTTGNNTVNFKVLSFAAQGFAAVSTGSQLTVGSLLTGGGGFVKALPGTLILNAPDDRAGYANLSGQTLTGNFEVNAGKVILNGGNNTLTPNQFLIVAPGATLDLNGTFQFAFGTRGDGAALQGNTGTFTNSSISTASALILGADNGGVNFGGIITQDSGAKPMSFLKAGGQTYNFSNVNTYSGATVFAGGTNVLLDNGMLQSTSSVAINYARLAFNDDANFALANRVNTTAPITMNGGSLVYTNGRAQNETTQTVGPVSLAEGQNFFQTLISNVTGASSVTSATLTLGSLLRPAGSSATVRFADVNPANTGVLNFGGLGTIGNAGRIVITSAPTLSRDLIGGWAVVDREFASYIPTLGVGALNTTGFAGYSSNFLNRQPLSTDNIRATLNVPGLTVDTTVNTLAVNTNVPAVNGVPVPTFIDLGGRKLTLAGGGLILAVNGDNQNITVQNGTITSTGPGVGTGSDLYVHALNYGGSNRTFTISAGIVNNSTGAVRLVKTSGQGDAGVGGATADFLMLSGVNTYTGGTVVNGGNLVVGAGGNIPAGGISISGGEVSGVGAIFQDVGGVINSANTVTVNGLGALSLVGSNTLAGLVFKDSGGGGTSPTVTTFRSLSPLGTGTLTLGGGGISSTPLNPVAVATVAGRLDFGVLASTVTVNTYDFSTFTDFAPTTAGLVLQGVIGSGGGITKGGGGVLQLNAQDVFTGALNVAVGTVQIGGFNSGSRFSQLNLSTTTSRLNLNGQSTVLGSLAGSGIVTNTTLNTPTLTVGFDNTNTTFSGQISRFNDATINNVPGNALTLVKIGTGTLTMTSAQSATAGSSGGVTVNGGGLTYSGLGASFPSTQITPVTYNVNTTGAITLDNSATKVDNRLGLGSSQGTLTLSGGTLALIGNAAGSNETINTLNFGSGASTIQFTPGGAATITVTGLVSGQGGQDSGLVTGNGLFTGNLNVVVSGSFPVVGGGGGVGQDNISIRADLLGDTAGGPGTGFLTRDTGTNTLRPLSQVFSVGELAADMVQVNPANTSNVGLTSPTNATFNRIILNQTINSLTLLGAGTPSLSSGLGVSAGVFGANAAPLTLTVTSGGFLALTNATIGIGAITSGGTTGDYHVVGAGTTLTLNGSIVSSTNGIVKADAGTLVFNARQYYTGSAGTNGTTVNGGTLRLNGGNNTIVVQPTGSIPTPLSLFMNGGTLDLNGNSQIVERIQNNNPNAGTGGIIINSGGSTVTLTSATGTSTTFAGSIGTGVLTPAGNAIDFVKSGNSTLTLTNLNSYTGSTVLRGGVLQLQDSATLATGGVTVNFGTLLLNEAGLNPLGVNPVRIPVASGITLNGGTLQQNSGGSLDASATFNTVTLASGGNIITQSTVQNAGSSALISIGSLVQQTTSATMNFASGNGTLGGGGLNNNQIQITNITPSGGGSTATASLLVNGMLPGWVTVNGADFAGYLPSSVNGSLGVGALGSANFPAYTGVLQRATSANNLSLTVGNAGSATTVVELPAAGRRVNSIAVRSPGTNTNYLIPTNLPTDTLTIGTGGLLINAGNGGTSVTFQGGRLTAGAVANAPGALYVTSNGGNTQTINSQIVDNGNQTYSANTDGISNVITVGSTSGLVVGQAVSGPGIPGGSTIQSINLNGTSFTIASPTTAASFKVADVPKTNSSLLNGSNAVTVANTTNLVVGEYVSGPGIPAGTTVTALGTAAVPNTITLSNPATATVTQQTFFATVGNNSTTITLSPAQAATLIVGMAVTGTNVPANTVITAVNTGTGQISVNNNTTGTAATQLLNFGATLNFARLGINVAMPTNTNASSVNLASVTVNNNTGVVAGMSVTGPGIPAGTIVAAFGNANLPFNTVPNSNTVILQAPVGQNFTMTGNTGINLEFGTNIKVGNNAAGAVSLVKTGTGTLTLTPQPVLNGSMNGGSNVIVVPTTTGLLAGMTVSGIGIPGGSTIQSISGPNTYVLSSNATATQGSQLSYGPGTSGVDVVNSAFSNNYTGGTFVNQGTLNLAGLAGAIVIPGNLTINGSTGGTVVTMVTNPQQIAAAGNVTINGNGTLNLIGANTLASLTFNDSGGNANPTVTLGTSGTLTLTNGLTVVNDSLSFTPTISGTTSTLILPNNTVTVSGASPVGLTLPILLSPTGALVKAGTGSVVLASANTFTTGVSLNGGSIILGANSTPSTVGAVVTSGPIGTGALTMADGTALLSDGTLRTIANALNITANATFGPLVGSGTALAGNGVILAGPVALAGGIAHTITVPDLQNVTTISGVMSGANVSLTKAGTGTLVLSNPGNTATLAGTALTFGGSVIVGGSTIAGSNTVIVASTAGITNGMTVSGTGIPGGVTVLAVSGNTVTLSTGVGVTTTNAMKVTAGVVRIGATSAVPAGLTLSVSPGAVYDLNGNGSQVLGTLSNPSPGTAGNGGMVTNSGGATTLFVGGTSTNDTTNGLGVTAVFDGILTAPNTGTAAAPNFPGLALTKVGRSNQILTGANLYSGATTVLAGQLTINGSLANTTVNVLGGGTLSGTGSIGNAFGGTVTLTGGTTAATQGTFSLNNGSIGSFTINTAGSGTALTVGSTTSGLPSLLNFDISNITTDRIDLTGSANLLVNLGGGIVNLTQLSGSPLAKGNYNLITYASTTGTGNFTGGTVTNGGSGTTFASNSYVLTKSGSSLILQVGGAVLNFFWKGDVSGAWNVTGANTNWATDVTGATDTADIPNATAIVTFKAEGSGTLNTTLGQDFTIDQLNFNATVPNTLVTIGGTNILTLNNNLTMVAGTGAVTISTNGLVLGSTQNWTNNSASTLTVSAPLTGSAPLTITSTSTGTVILSGINSNFTGGITVAGNGTNTALQAGSATALGPVAGPNPLVVNIGALDLFGFNATVSSLSSTAATGIIKNTNGSTTSILTVNQIATTTYSGAIQDSGTAKVGLTVDGGGTLQLVTTANTYSGGTIINNATLRMGNNGAENAASLGTGLVTINAGGTLNFSPGGSTTTFNILNTLSLNGGLIQSSGGNQHLFANSVAPATINVTAAGGTITPSVTSGQDLFVDGVLAGSGTLTVGGTGSGKVILTNNGNTYSGTFTSTSAGNLQLAGTAAASTALQFATVSLANGANGLTFNGIGTPITSAIFGSLSGGGNFALQNTAASPAAIALTVGGNNAGPLTYTGVMSNSAVGINGTFTKTGSGTLTLSGLNTYRGTTTVTGSGALRVSNSSTTVSVTGLGNVVVNNTATLGGNGVIQGGDNVTPGSIALSAGTFLDPGLSAGGFGTLRFGVQTAAAVNTTLTLFSGSTYKFDLGAGAGSQDRVSVVGPAAISGANLTINVPGSAPDQGKYTLLSATTTLSGTFNLASAIPAGYSLIYTANTVDLQKFATIGTISTPVGLQVIKGASVPFAVTVQNSAPTGSADLSFTANSTPGTNTSGGPTSAVVVGAQTSGTANGLSFNSTAVAIGPATVPNGTFTVTAAGASNSPQTGSVSVDVLDHAAFAPFTGGTLTLPNVRVGYVGPITSANALTVTNAAGFRVDLKGSAAAPIGNLSVNGVSAIAAGTSKNITATLASGQGQGSYSQNFTYTLGDDSTLSGTNNGNLGSVTITVNGNVYNGQGIWGANPSGSWGTFTNWTLPGGYPGLDGDASINDTATFGSTLTGTASLDGVSPLINSLSFNNSSGTIAQGTGSGSVTLRANQNLVAPAINVTGGTPTVSAPMVFQDTVTATISGANDRLTISGPVTGAGGLTKTGLGNLVLSGTNGYSGKTAVNAGTLTATNSASLGAIPSLVAVPDQIAINNGATLAFTGSATLETNQGITVGAGTATLNVAASQTLIVKGQLSGSGTLNKTGAGTLDVRSFIQGPLTLTAGTFAPTVGTPTSLITGSLNFGGGAAGNRTLAIDVLGTNGEGNPGGHDVLFASAAVTISATTNLSINLGTFHPSPGVDAFRFINDGSGNTPTYASFFFVAGQDAGVAGGSGAFNANTNHVGKTFFVGSDAFQIDYAGGTGSDVVLLSVVPEPGSAVMMLGGIGLLALVSRRRRRVPFGV